MDQNDRVDMGTFEINSAQEIQDKLASLKDASTNKPSEEEIELVKKELDLTSEEFREKLYEIGKPDEFEKIYNFIHNFLENALWMKEAWMGILKLDEEIDETFNKDFTIRYLTNMESTSEDSNIQTEKKTYDSLEKIKEKEPIIKDIIEIFDCKIKNTKD